MEWNPNVELSSACGCALSAQPHALDSSTFGFHFIENSGTACFTNCSSNLCVIPKLLYANRDVVGRYVCTASNTHGNISATIIFRLEVSWTVMKIYSIFCGIGTALAFFALNVIWAGIRSIIMWRLARMERTSRIRKMLEAMEKYRQKQAEGLHDKYTTKMNAIRENYHMQAEQLRRSYASQVERFRDYKAQQIGAVSSHVESARESYTAQMTRVREYGSKQMERVYESYQRQMNRVRTFSLQQRLRLMRQYKIKHRYLNKLLEGLNIDYSRSASDHVARAEMMTLPRLDEEDEDDPLGLNSSFPGWRDEDAFSVSTYHSLPDIEMEDFPTSSHSQDPNCVIEVENPIQFHDDDIQGDEERITEIC